MSGAVKQVGKLFGGKSSAAPAAPQAAAPQAAAPASASEKPRVASPEERAIALRRRRGTRSLLSAERIEAEAGLGGQQTTLGG